MEVARCQLNVDEAQALASHDGDLVAATKTDENAEVHKRADPRATPRCENPPKGKGIPQQVPRPQGSPTIDAPTVYN